MTTVTRSLFGGVLLSAGLVADAESQKLVLSGRQSLFNNASTAVEVFGYDYCSIGGFNALSLDGGIGDSIGYSLINAYGSASITETQFTSVAYADGGCNLAIGELIARGWAAVAVDQDAVLEVTWDFTEEGFNILGFTGVEIVDETAGDVELFTTQFEQASGTAYVPVFAGAAYRIRVQASVGFIDGDVFGTGPTYSAFAMVTLIPAPASIVLMSLTGLAAARRRR